MPIIASTWSHGNAVVAEHPAGGALQDVDGRAYTAVVGHRLGWGATYEGTGDSHIRDTWFHIPIPTLTTLSLAGVATPSGGRLFLDSLHLLFDSVNCPVVSVTAWDLKTQIPLFHGPNSAPGLQGDWSTFGQTATNEHGQTLTNVWSTHPDDRTPRHAMLFGLGMSILVDFSWGGPPRRITFFGAGATWADRPIG